MLTPLAYMRIQDGSGVCETFMGRAVGDCVSAQMEGYLGTWKPRNYTAQRAEDIPMEGHPETLELRRGSPAELRSLSPTPSSLHCFLASSNERVTLGSKPRGRRGGPRAWTMNLCRAARCREQGLNKGQGLYRIFSRGRSFSGQRFPE